nr:nuclear pore complex protein NUP1-like isoform X1 [Ipomoea trifida]
MESLYGERGAGGKLKNPPSRKPPASPYARPPATPATRIGSNGWLSRLVDPAYQLISSSATRIFPSFFSKSPSDVPPLLPIAQSNGVEVAEVIPNSRDEENCTPCHVSRSTEGIGASVQFDTLKKITECERLEQEKPEISDDDSVVSRIEQLMKGKAFSRDEIIHLIEILNSKVDEQENNQKCMTAERDNERVLLLHETPRQLSERKLENMTRALPGPSTPISESSVPEVSGSPIDIARAYMGSQISYQTLGPNFVLIKDEPDPVNDICASEPVITSPSSKPSTSWPGALVPEQPGRFGFHEFSRTPYSRTLLSKSRTKSQADSRCLESSVKPFPQSQTSQYGQVRTKSDVYDYGYGSAGPIRRIRNRFSSESHHTGSIFLNSSKPTHSPIEKLTASKIFLPSIGKNMEIGESSGTSMPDIKGACTSGHAFPSEATTRMIIDHLNRHKPTPKEKAAELKLATEWNKSPGAEVSDARPNESALPQHLGNSKVGKRTELANPESLKGRGSDKDDYQVKSEERSMRVAEVAKDASALTSIKAGDFVVKTDASTEPSLDFKSTNSQFKSSISNFHDMSSDQDFVGSSSGQKATNQNLSFQHQSNGQNVSTTSRSIAAHTSGTKPTLPFISISKPHPRSAVSYDNSFGFTFPVPASSGSEPPTPSMALFSPSVIPPSIEPSAAAPYSFGTKISSSQHLVFSFPSSGSAVQSDASGIQFNFGADRKTTRLSFGKAVC